MITYKIIGYKNEGFIIPRIVLETKIFFIFSEAREELEILRRSFKELLFVFDISG
jgi:hypothetical protein